MRPRGQVATILLIAMPVLLAMFVLTCNILLLSVAKQKLQTATDSAAIAAACYLDADYSTAASAYLQLNDPGAHIVSLSVSGNSVTITATASVNAIGAATVAARAVATAYPVGSLHRAEVVQ